MTEDRERMDATGLQRRKQRMRHQRVVHHQRDTGVVVAVVVAMVAIRPDIFSGHVTLSYLQFFVRLIVFLFVAVRNMATLLMADHISIGWLAFAGVIPSF